MVFSSPVFLFWFLPLALLGYLAARRLGARRTAHAALTALSYLFYGWANPPFVLLMAFSTGVDFVCGLVISRRQPWTPDARDAGAEGPELPLCAPGGPRTRAQKAALVVSVCTNLGLLGFFKYANFAVESWNGVVEVLGLSHLAWREFLRITLPLGISFYTFQSLSYTIDVYRGHARATRSLLDFACYVSLFPQLVAGPIIRFSEVAHQLLHRTHTLEKFARGVAMFSLGMGKKVLIANPVGKIADVCFGAGSLGALEAWTGALAYSFQIYFDFSGYTDMAIGLGLMLGFVFPKNFDSPYRSRSLTEFWRRWHISLSSWLRDYLYVPLGGNRRGPGRTQLNVLIVMLLGGLWHGAAATFVVWGGLHGLGLVLERRRGGEDAWRGLPPALRVAGVFALVTVAWVFFRAPDLDAALAYLGHMLGQGAVQPGAELLPGLVGKPYYLGTLALAAGVTWLAPQSWDWTRRVTPWRAAVCLALLALAAATLTTQAFNPFIYFIF